LAALEQLARPDTA